MQEHVTLRNFQSSDYEAIRDVIRETWQYDRFCSQKTARKLAAVYLDSCLANQTYTQTAVVGGVPVGIIMGKNIAKHRCPFSLRMRLLFSTLSLLCSREGRKVSGIFKNVSSVDKELLETCNQTYPGEVAFFAISAKYRGKGIGKALFGRLTEYMKERGFIPFTCLLIRAATISFMSIRAWYENVKRSHPSRSTGKSRGCSSFSTSILGCRIRSRTGGLQFLFLRLFLFIKFRPQNAVDHKNDSEYASLQQRKRALQEQHQLPGKRNVHHVRSQDIFPVRRIIIIAVSALRLGVVPLPASFIDFLLPVIMCEHRVLTETVHTKRDDGSLRDLLVISDIFATTREPTGIVGTILSVRITNV